MYQSKRDKELGIIRHAKPDPEAIARFNNLLFTGMICFLLGLAVGMTIVGYSLTDRWQKSEVERERLSRIVAYYTDLEENGFSGWHLDSTRKEVQNEVR